MPANQRILIVKMNEIKSFVELELKKAMKQKYAQMATQRFTSVIDEQWDTIRFNVTRNEWVRAFRHSPGKRHRDSVMDHCRA